jgi:hypothetical protein
VKEAGCSEHIVPYRSREAALKQKVVDILADELALMMKSAGISGNNKYRQQI